MEIDISVWGNGGWRLHFLNLGLMATSEDVSRCKEVVCSSWLRLQSSHSYGKKMTMVF